ncbi:MAG: hypothetical protein CMM07_09295 [Rhodopirellula sp.]|nr:hypothetical protein [Rhodopirellula sp.]
MPFYENQPSRSSAVDSEARLLKLQRYEVGALRSGCVAKWMRCEVVALRSGSIASWCRSLGVHHASA